MNLVSRHSELGINSIILVAVFLFCAVPGTDEQHEQADEAIAFARTYSGTQSSRSWKESYWDHVAQFTSSTEFNKCMALSRDSLRYLSREDQWKWETDSLRKIFYDCRSVWH